MNNTVRKVIMLRFELKNRPNKSRDTRDIKTYQQQRNLVVRLNKDSKYSYFRNLHIRKEHSGILANLITFNKYFGNIVQSFKIFFNGQVVS